MSNPEHHLPWPLQPDRVYILCTRVERGLLGRTIQWVTRHASEMLPSGLLSPHAHLGPYNHMGIISTFAPFDEYGQSRSRVEAQGWDNPTGATTYEALGSGWSRRELAAYRDPAVRCDVFELPDLDRGAAEDIVKCCEILMVLGVDYDLPQLIGAGIERFIWGWRRLHLLGFWRRRKLICSEGVAVVIRDASGLNICGKWHLSVYTPTDIRHTCDIGAARFVGTITWLGPRAGREGNAAEL